jgi:hypothetical protein
MRKRGGEHRTSKGSLSFKVQVFSFKSEKEDLETEEVRKEAAFFFEPQSTIYEPASNEEELSGNF